LLLRADYGRHHGREAGALNVGSLRRHNLSGVAGKLDGCGHRENGGHDPKETNVASGCCDALPDPVRGAFVTGQSS
jgi:hypothetical protein